MGSLISLTFITGLTDSLNPFGIAQQFTLQGLIKKSEHIWFYIIAMFPTNFSAGILFYWGMATLNSRVLTQYWEVLESPLSISAIVVALFLAWKSIRSILISWRARKLLIKRGDEDAKGLEEKFATKEMTKSYLFGIGLLTTIMELTTAAPYIAYLALIQQYQLNTWSFLGILFIYNVLYSLPLIVLYLLSVFFEDAFQTIYRRLDGVLQVLSAFLVPVILLIIALILVTFSLQTI